MGKLQKLVGAVAVALSVGMSGASATTFRLNDPVRVITVAPSERKSEGLTSRDLLEERLGTAAATSRVSATEGDVTRSADLLARIDSAARQYGAVRVTVYQMADESVAYVLLHSLEPAGAPRAAVGDDGWSSDTKLAFRAGAYTVFVDGGAADARDSVAAALVERIGRQLVRVPLARVLPTDAKVADTEHYAPSFEALRPLRPDLSEDVYLFGAGGADAVLADYTQSGAAPMRILIVDYQTPQLAADAERSLAAYYAGLAPDARQQRVFRREGNYLVEATDVANRDVAERLVGTVKYDIAIKMLKGDDPSSLLNFAEEAQKTAMVFINSFAIVGIGFGGAIAIGLVVGAVLFRRRRAAAENVFSDAGGMTHLDLGPHGQLRPAESTRLLSSGRID